MYLPRVLTALSRVTAVAKCFPLVEMLLFNFLPFPV